MESHEFIRHEGIRHQPRGAVSDARLLAECTSLVVDYLKAWQSGVWDREASFFSDTVNYYDDQNVSRDFIRESME